MVKYSYNHHCIRKVVKKLLSKNDKDNHELAEGKKKLYKNEMSCRSNTFERKQN